MGIFSRLTDIVNSNINSILDRAQDPEKIIRLIIQEMEDTLVEVRSGAVRTIAEKKEIERRLEGLRREHDDWQRRDQRRTRQAERGYRQAAGQARRRQGARADDRRTDEIGGRPRQDPQQAL
jgi:phage shock protein A